MSRAFVKEDDAAPPEPLPPRQLSSQPNDVTAQGLTQLQDMLNAAREAFAAARVAGDNAAAARAHRDLRYWSARLATARVVPGPTDSSEVRFGSTVSIKREDGREQSFRIVGEDEADPRRGTISHASPLARALLGKGVGELATFGDTEVVIQSIG
jgi:transcription elongation GreA/GreB family factor